MLACASNTTVKAQASHYSLSTMIPAYQNLVEEVMDALTARVDADANFIFTQLFYHADRF